MMRRIGILVVFGLSLVEGVAFAQNRDPAAAQTLFDDGKTLMKEGRYADACAKFLASHRIDPKSGTVLNLADCYEKNGQSASAWLRYLEAAELSARSHNAEREKYAREHAAELAPKLARLTIAVRGLPSGSIVKRDGVALDAQVFDVAVPVDPGEHTVDAKTPDGASWSGRVNVVSGLSAKIAIPPAGEWAPQAKPILSEPPPPPPRAVESSWPAQKILAVTALGVALVGVGIGSYFGLASRSTWTDAKAGCLPEGCPTSSLAGVSDARTEATISTVAFIVGGAALAGAGVLWFAF